MKNPMPTFAVYMNNTFKGYVRAVSYRQAVKRARKTFRGPVDVIGEICNAERTMPHS